MMDLEKARSERRVITLHRLKARILGYEVTTL